MLNQLLIPSLTNQLTALSGWLDKAEAWAGEEGVAVDALLARRVAPDMWPLAAQVRLAAFQAMEPIYRLRGLPVPDDVLAIRQEGRDAGDHPGTLAEARARLAQALDLIHGVDPAEFDADPDRPLAHDLPMGMVFDMTAAGYVRDWAIPQAAFHQLAAYMILRAAGVPLGKADYVPHMFAYLRPGTMPGG